MHAAVLPSSDSHGCTPPRERTVVRNNDINGYADLYAAQRPQNLAWNDKSGLGQVITNAAKMYSTNCENHVSTNVLKRLKQWIGYKLTKHIGHLLQDYKEVGKICEWLHFEVCRSVGDMSPNIFPATAVANLHDNNNAPLFFLRVEHVFNCAIEIVDAKSMDLQDIKSGWWSNLPLLHKI